jgi:hypothetical protein
MSAVELEAEGSVVHIESCRELALYTRSRALQCTVVWSAALPPELRRQCGPPVHQ